MLGEQIRTLREARHLTQVELARGLAVTKQAVSNWENNNILPSVETISAIADYFGVTVDHVLGRDAHRYIVADGLTDEQLQLISSLVQQLRRDPGP